MDVSSEMVVNILPLFWPRAGSSNQHHRLIEGIAESTASILKLFSGWLRINWAAENGLPLPVTAFRRSPTFFLHCQQLELIAVYVGLTASARRRTAPRDALVADSVTHKHAAWPLVFTRHGYAVPW